MEPPRVDRPLRASGRLTDAGDGAVRDEDVSVERVVAGANVLLAAVTEKVMESEY